MWYLVKSEFNKKNIWFLLGGLFFVTLEVGSNIALPILLSFLTSVIDPNNRLEIFQEYSQQIQAVIVVFIMISIGIVGLTAGYIGELINSKFAITIVNSIRIKTYNKIQAFSYVDFDNFKTSSLVTRITTDIYLIQESIIFILKIVYRGVLLYIGGLIGIGILISIEHQNQWVWVIPIIVVIASIILIIFGAIIMYLSVKFYDRFLIEQDNTNAIVRNNILGVRVVKVFRLYDQQMEKFENQNEAVKRIGIKSEMAWQFGVPLVTLLMNITIVAVLGFGAITNTINIAQIITLIQLIEMMMLGLTLMMLVVGYVGVAYAGSKRIKQILTYKVKISYKEDGLEIVEPVIEIKDLNFRYNQSGDYVLKNINLKINQHETIGIIGGTGSGKTSLINLIARLYDFNEGTLKISNIDIKEISEASLRKEIAISPQKVTLFSGTIASNLKYGKKDADENDMVWAAKIAEAYNFVQTKEAGFKSRVEQRGRNFSGGQKQRLSIARAIIKNAKILILDDSTSALDMITEKNVQHNLKTELPKQTKIIVAQRISSVKNADRIIVLENGEIIGNDTHDNLLKNCKLYQEIYESQTNIEI